MDDAELDDLQDPESWDFDSAERMTPVAAPQAVVAVTFDGDEFILLAKHVEQAGAKLSEFIREAALEKAGVAVSSDSRQPVPGARVG